MFYSEGIVKIGVPLMFANCLLDNKQTHNAKHCKQFSVKTPSATPV